MRSLHRHWIIATLSTMAYPDTLLLVSN